MRKRRQGASASEGEKSSLEAAWPPDWMTTYSDMATLLMTFFIILSTMLALKINPAWIAGEKYVPSQVREQALIEEPVSVMEVPEDIIELARQIELLESEQIQDMILVEDVEKLGEEIRQYIMAEKLEKVVAIDISNWKVTIIPLVPFLFTPGRAVLRPEGREFLDRLAAFLEINPMQVRISGHSDSLPIRNRSYPSNWELSSARAAAVMRYFVEKHGADPTRFAAIGYGPYRPVASNDTPEGRARNRRVEIEFIQRVETVPGEFSGVRLRHSYRPD